MPIRTGAGIALLILASLFSTIKLNRPAEQFLYKITGVTDIVPDEVTLDEQRFKNLKPLLPPHTTVGYLADREGDIASHERYMRVRYILSPIVVEQGTHHALVIGNLTQPSTDLDAFLKKHDVALLKDFGGGAMLLVGNKR